MSMDKDLETIAEIDRVVHSPTRLMILAYLGAVDSADFIFLMNQVNLTRGNLSSHLKALEESSIRCSVSVFSARKSYKQQFIHPKVCVQILKKTGTLVGRRPHERKGNQHQS
jgi:DNA-binding transcriptional ArsR family regulator